MGAVRVGGKPTTGETGAAMSQWLSDMLALQQPRLVVFEAPLLHRDGIAGSQAPRILFGLCMIVEAVCHLHEVPCREAHLQQVRKAAVGSGLAKKDDVMAWAKAQGWSPQTHDVADACAVWVATIKTMNLRSAA